MSETQIKLAQALLRRKELQEKVDRIATVKDKDIFEVVSTRRPAHEGIDDVICKVPKLNLSEVTREYDFYAKRLRLVDAAIQQANWTTDIPVDSIVNEDYADVMEGAKNEQSTKDTQDK